MSTPTKEQMLAVARKQINETEIPFGSNRTKFSLWYGLIGPWCAMFVSWCADQCGATSIIPRHAYTPSGAAWFQARGLWGRTPRVGAIVYYEFPGINRISHGGIVEQVHSDGSWTAIEGNTDEAGGRTGGKVMRKRRFSVGRRGGFGYPQYARSVVTSGSPLPSVGVKPTVKGWQTLLAFAPVLRDGAYGPNTEQRSQWMRTAARYVSGTLSGSAKSTIQLIERVIGNPDDGIWSTRDRTAMTAWVKRAQSFLGVTADGAWGPKTDAAFLAFRKSNYKP